MKAKDNNTPKGQHTTGFWETANNGEYIDINNIKGRICSIYKDAIHEGVSDIEEQEAEANAKLISCAPELLEGCQIFAEYLKTHGKQNSILYTTIIQTIKNATK